LHKPLTGYEQEAAAHAALADMTERIYALVGQREAPPFFVDLQRVFATESEPRYIDFCHLVGAGNRTVADAMLPRVLTALRNR
ncbi:MAG: hypothetical protein ACO4CZ_03030, partial [Planctomycetota bacterium]